MEAIAIKTEPPEHVEATPRSSTTSAAVAAAETTKQPTTQNVAIEKSRCGEIFVTNNAKKWTFTCTYCDKTTRDIGEFICHIQFKHMNGQYNEDGGADNENELQPTTTLQNNAAEKPTNNQQPNILFQSLTQPIINEPQTQTYPVTPTIATVSSLANSNNVPFEYSDSTNESDDFNNAQQKPQHSKSLKITNPQSLNRSKRKHDEMAELENVKRPVATQDDFEIFFVDEDEEDGTIMEGDDIAEMLNEDDDDVEFIGDDDMEYNKLLFLEDGSNSGGGGGGVGVSGRQTKAKKNFCHICSKYISNDYRYQNHMFKHSQASPYKCEFCSKSFKSVQAIGYHLKTHSKNDQYHCSICPSIQYTENNFITHVLTHETETCFPCMVCGIVSNSDAERDEHLKTHEKDRPFACDFCKRRFRKHNFLTNHLRSHCQYRCDFCPSDFHSTQSQRRPYICPTCEKSPTVRKQAEAKRSYPVKNQAAESDNETEDESEASGSKFTETSTNRLRCQFCYASFINKHNLAFHVKKKHASELIFS